MAKATCSPSIWAAIMASGKSFSLSPSSRAARPLRANGAMEREAQPKWGAPQTECKKARHKSTGALPGREGVTPSRTTSAPAAIRLKKGASHSAGYGSRASAKR